MKFTAALSLALATFVAAMPAEDLSKRQAIKKGGSTLVFKEQGGVPGNECLTFRNNGTIPCDLDPLTLSEATSH